jgi:DMSO/TMAO reductase YedYZ molybdopterin-dependent catalytic subunit
MNQREISRRALLKGSATLTALVALGFPLEVLEAQAAAGEQVIPWLDQPPPFPGPPEQVATQLVWEQLGSYLTWNEKFFTVQHYGQWLVIREPDWRLEIDGLVQRPQVLTLAQLRARPRQQVAFTLECSGNHGFPFFIPNSGVHLYNEAIETDRPSDG